VFVGPSDRFGRYIGQVITGYLFAEVAAGWGGGDAHPQTESVVRRLDRKPL